MTITESDVTKVVCDLHLVKPFRADNVSRQGVRPRPRSPQGAGRATLTTRWSHAGPCDRVGHD